MRANYSRQLVTMRVTNKINPMIVKVANIRFPRIQSISPDTRLTLVIRRPAPPVANKNNPMTMNNMAIFLLPASRFKQSIV